MRAHQIWTLGNVQENKNIYITVNPIFQIWISSPIALAGESANWQVSWDLSNVSFFHFFFWVSVCSAAISSLANNSFLFPCTHNRCGACATVLLLPLELFPWKVLREKWPWQFCHSTILRFWGFSSLTLSLTHTNASVFCNSVWINQHGKYDKKAVICVFSALSLSLLSILSIFSSGRMTWEHTLQ